MKGKRYTTEQKIRILRSADQADKTILDVCREAGMSEQTFHRWKRVCSWKAGPWALGWGNTCAASWD